MRPQLKGSTVGSRRGRKMAIAGASAFALVLPLAVALPASAAEPTAPTVTVTAPAQIANDGTTATITAKVTTGPTASDDDLPATSTYTLQLTLPDGVTCSDLTWTTPTSTASSITASSNGGSGQTCTSSLSGALATTDSPDTLTFKVDVDGQTPGTAFNPPVYVTGDIGVKVGVEYGASSPVTASDTSQLVTPGTATFADSVAQPTFGSTYSADLVTSPGFPNSAETYTVVRATQDSAGTWDTTTDVRKADSTGTTNDAYVAVTVGTDTTRYMSLNTAALAVSTSPVDGFFLNLTTGKIVFGELSDVTSATAGFTAATFTPKAVNSRAGSVGTWTVLAENSSWTTTASSADDAKPAVTANQVASGQFMLNVAFSDVSDSNVFKDAINALSSNPPANPVVIKGYGDGTFGATNNVTRGEFAAFVYRTLDQGSLTAPSYTCNGTTPSNYTDVTNVNVFCDAINGLASVGIINGTTATTFAPNAKVTRDQAVAFIYRANSYLLSQAVADAAPTNTQFDDVTSSNIFSGDIKWGANNGVVNGRTATTFDPAGNVLRQEAAAFIYRYGHNLQGMFS